MTDGGQGVTHADRIALFGGPLDTGNLGVSALGTATLTSVARRQPAAELLCFDNGSGRRSARVGGSGGPTVTFRGAWLSRRLHRSESLWSMEVASRTWGRSNANVRELDRCRAVLDVSGGDSFSDIYGSKRFAQVTLPKRITLRRGRPLYLLPQTYGPFASDAARTVARRIVLNATQSWARDAASFERLQELVGDGFDPGRHRLGVDVAFALEPREPGGLGDIAGWLTSGEPVVGVNVSGLLANRADAARDRFGIRADQISALAEVATRWLRQGVRVLLVPHVRGDSWESDDRASQQLLTMLGAPNGLAVLPAGLDAAETKWCVSQLSWFVGARMHATIAALSTGVPVGGIAYSDKILGVFSGCDVADQVIDARTQSTGTFVDQIWAAWEDRERVRTVLANTSPRVVARASDQFDEIVGSVTQASTT